MPMAMGFVAGLTTSVAALPQVVKTIRTHSTRDLSLWQPLLLTVGVRFWMLYGAIIKDIPLLVMNVLPLGANMLLAILKMKEGKICGNSKEIVSAPRS